MANKTNRILVQKALEDPLLLRELYDYNSLTGSLTYKIEWHYTTVVGQEVGVLESVGYRSTRLCGVHKKVHHIIVAWMLGFWPIEVDHIDHQRSNNKWDNLIVTSRAKNMLNKSLYRINKHGIPGISIRKHKWLARIRHNSKDIYLGSFTNLLDAASARKSAEYRLGFHTNHGGV